MSEVEWMKIFGENLKEMLEDANMTQQELADATGISQATISKYIKGTQMPTAKAIVNITYELSCEMYDLVDFGDKVY